MIWISVLVFLLFIFLWLLLAPIELSIDTRVSQVCIRWITIGKIFLVYEEEDWWLAMQVLFIQKKWSLMQILFRPTKKKKTKTSSVKRHRIKKKNRFAKIINLLKTFRIRQWQIAIDSGDPTVNAWLYPVNFLPVMHQHVWVNFKEENYMAITIRNVPLRMVLSFLK